MRSEMRIASKELTFLQQVLLNLRIIRDESEWEKFLKAHDESSKQYAHGYWFSK
jgi:hypothetical protein